MSEAFTAALRAPSRLTALSGNITCLTGETLSVSADQALAFSLSEGASDGRLLGGAFSASCSVTLDDHDGFFTGHRSLAGAQVRLRLDCGGESAPLCVFTVSRVTRRENDCRLVLSGSDALGTAFEGPLEDDFAYPITLGALASRVAAQAGFSLAADFPNAGFSIPVRPDWGDVSLRQALGHIACAAGCFACISRDGRLVFRPVRSDDAPYALPAEMTLEREYGDAVFGPLTGLSISCAGAPRDAQPLTVQADDTPLSETNCLSVSGNPLFPYGGAHTQALAEALLNALRGLSQTRARLSWRGDPALCLGRRLRLTDSAGSVTDALVTSQTLTFFHGFSMQTACLSPARQAAAGRIFTAGGALNAARLAGSLDGVIIRDGTIAARALVAGSVTAQQIAARSITAEKLAAGSVTADKIAAADLNAINAKLGTADIAKAQITTANIENADIDWARIHGLRAASADIVSAQIGEADIDFAHVKDLATDTALITQGSGDKLYIRRLAVDSAQMVDLTVGQFTVKAKDGSYYRLDVDIGSGSVTATRVTVTADEIAAGQTSSGQHIIETDLTVSDLNAASATAAEALINKLTAARLDVDTLFARDAVLHKIEAMDITGNQYLRLLVNSRSRNYDRWDDPASASGSAVQDGDVWRQGVPFTTWQALETLTWAQAAQYPWWAFAGSRLHIRKDGQWDTVSDPQELLALQYQLSRYRAQVLVTDDKIDLQAQRQQETEDSLGRLTVRSDGIETAVQRQGGDISALQTWKSQASQQITPDAIVQTVRESRGYQGDLGEKYDIQSGVAIRSAGVEISGGKYVKIKSGGSFQVESGRFSIDENGNVRVAGRGEFAEGVIGGWSIEPNKLSSGTGGSHVELSTAGDYAFFAGRDYAARESAPFRVRRDGTVYLTRLIAVDEQGNETAVNLQTYPFWKLWYKTIKSVENGVVTLSDGSTFNTAGSVTLSGAWVGTAYQVTASNGKTSTSEEVKPARIGGVKDSHKINVRLYTSGLILKDFADAVDATPEYNAGYAAGWAAAKAAISLSGNQIIGPAADKDTTETLFTITAGGGLNAIQNTAPNTFFVGGYARAYINSSEVANKYISKSTTISVGQ